MTAANRKTTDITQNNIVQVEEYIRKAKSEWEAVWVALAGYKLQK